ncbi:HEPN domain-containing protein [Anaerotalea alkaliphila]|uniref:HEPN domain-containing protein n=1 Tax=Anaerotalea alkaliphila TaxID=2662126 RepID=A0A7X5HTX6_9FIRM|nr:HEPN domain-containing protein [Anaerotalea alkaliphila]NDL66341.1 HEPN domain-containing protein [Anaerotalea alkaliphila]
MSSFLHLAKADLKYVRFGLQNCDDEIELNYAAYHLHQAIEKLVKASLELAGIDLLDRTFRTHDIDFLISRLPKEVEVPEAIRKNLYKINRWVSEPRYNINFRQSREDVEAIYKAALWWLDGILKDIGQGEES